MTDHSGFKEQGKGAGWLKLAEWSLGKRDFEQGYYESVGKSGKESVAAATTANISKRNND